MLRELRKANVARDKEWNTGEVKFSLSFRGNELGGESGEVQNVIKKLERERMGVKGSRSTKEALAKELADVVICADLIAMDEDIDLGAAVAEKFNETSEQNGFLTRLFRRVVRHLKRGSVYDVVTTEAEVQISRPETVTRKTHRAEIEWTSGRLLKEGDKLVVYQSQTDGKIWIRFPDEFADGRFEDMA